MLKTIKSGCARVSVMLRKRVLLVAVLVIASICAAALLGCSVNTIQISEGENTKTVYTFSQSVDNAIGIAGYKTSNYKVLSTDITKRGAKISLAYAFPVYITSGEETKELVAIKSTVGEILAEAGYTVDEFDMVEPTLDTVVDNTTYIDYTNIDYISGSYTETIPHTVKTVYSNKYDEGTQKLVAGSDGVQQVNYTAKVVNGVTVESVIDSKIVLTAAVQGTKTVGTKKAAVTTSESIKTISTLKPASAIELDANGVPVSYSKKLTVQATAYTYTGKNCSTGVAPQPGYIAVNPKVIPYGTKMYIKTADGSYIYGYAVAADTGGFIKSRPNNVDLFFSTKAACTAFGRRNVEIYILE